MNFALKFCVPRCYLLNSQCRDLDPAVHRVPTIAGAYIRLAKVEPTGKTDKLQLATQVIQGYVSVTYSHKTGMVVEAARNLIKRQMNQVQGKHFLSINQANGSHIIRHCFKRKNNFDLIFALQSQVKSASKIMRTPSPPPCNQYKLLYLQFKKERSTRKHDSIPRKLNVR